MSFISAIFIFSAAGLINSHQLIQYSSNLRSLLLEMANKSDFYIDDIYLLEGVSLYSSHGSNEYDAVKNKKCSVNKLENKKEISFFVYNHRFPLDIENNKEHLNDLIGHSNGCIRNDDIVETIQKIEKTRNFDIEQNNRIYNGGSSAYAYLLKVIKAD